MFIKFLGHASLAITIENIKILVDPFISGNPKASHIDINTLEVDYILVTHAHQDHLLDVDDIARRTNATIISNFEITNHYLEKQLNFECIEHFLIS